MTVDGAIAHFLRRQTAVGMAAMVANGASLWDALTGFERFQAGLARREVGEVLRSLNAFLVLASVQRVRPDLVQIIGSQQGLRWLDAQLTDLKARFSG